MVDRWMQGWDCVGTLHSDTDDGHGGVADDDGAADVESVAEVGTHKHPLVGVLASWYSFHRSQ